MQRTQTHNRVTVFTPRLSRHRWRTALWSSVLCTFRNYQEAQRHEAIEKTCFARPALSNWAARLRKKARSVPTRYRTRWNEFTFSGTLASVLSRKIEVSVSRQDVLYPQPGSRMRLSDNTDKAFASRLLFNASVEVLRVASVDLILCERRRCSLVDRSQAPCQGKRRPLQAFRELSKNGKSNAAPGQFQPMKIDTDVAVG